MLLAPGAKVTTSLTAYAVFVLKTPRKLNPAPLVPFVPFVPAGPAMPCKPCAPVNPIGPMGPVAPTAPVAPVRPCGPVGPGTPCGPCGPVILSPIGPCGPTAPLRPLVPLAPACAIMTHGEVPGRAVPAATGPVATYVDVEGGATVPPVPIVCVPEAPEYVHWLSPLMLHVP